MYDYTGSLPRKQSSGVSVSGLKGCKKMSYKNDFIKFMADCGVLTFGDFTLKSGRKAPYFINTGNYKTGAQLAKLGGFYADCIMEHNIDVECLFGPAYKGIPLASCAAIALAEKYNKDVSFCFDRKEVKDHGEGGLFVGKQPAKGEMEKALDTELSAVQQAYKDYGIRVYSIVNINDIIAAIEEGVVDGKEYLEKMREYRKTYGVN